MFRDAGEKQKGSLNRILNIWQERGVYSQDYMKKLREELGTNSLGTFLYDDIWCDYKFFRALNYKSRVESQTSCKPRKLCMLFNLHIILNFNISISFAPFK